MFLPLLFSLTASALVVDECTSDVDCTSPALCYNVRRGTGNKHFVVEPIDAILPTYASPTFDVSYQYGHICADPAKLIADPTEACDITLANDFCKDGSYCQTTDSVVTTGICELLPLSSAVPAVVCPDGVCADGVCGFFESGYFVDEIGNPTASAKCHPILSKGDDCSITTAACINGADLYCNTNCVDMPVLGETCVHDEYCADGFECDGSNVCIDPLASSSTVAPSSSTVAPSSSTVAPSSSTVAPSSSSSSTEVPEPPTGALGDFCSVDGVCDGDLECHLMSADGIFSAAVDDNGRCMVQAVEGGRCDVRHYCAAGLFCKYGSCQKRGIDNGVCDANLECENLAFTCQDGVCRRHYASGSASTTALSVAFLAATLCVLI